MASYANGVIPNNNVSITDVRQTLGLSNTQQWNSLGWLCAGARSGGKSGSAFNIVENGASNVDGLLIDGAEPYFNIWSNESPGQWRLPLHPEKDYVRFELKRENENSRKYCYKLGAFRAYEHKATPASAMNISQTYYTGQPIITARYLPSCDLGSYDWKKIQGATHCKIVVDGGYVSSIKPIVKGFIKFDGEIVITVSGQNVATYKYANQISLCNSVGDDIVKLPTDGEISLVVKRLIPQYQITVGALDNDGRVIRFNIDNDDIQVVGNTIRVNGYVNISQGNVSASSSRLQFVRYEGLDDDGNVIETLTVTSDFTESPLWLSDYFQGDNAETFTASLTRLSYGRLRVYFDYE